MTKSAENRHIQKAATWLLSNHPYFATMALMCRFEEDPKIETMATDGSRIIYNADFVASLSEAERRGVLVHEVMHISGMHMTRRGNRSLKDWNIACDYAINPEVSRVPGCSLPKGALMAAKYDGMSAEAIYAALHQDPQGGGAQPKPQPQGGGDQQQQPPQGGGGSKPQQPQQGGSGQAPDPGKCGGVIDAAPAHDEAKIKAVEAEIKARIFNAASAAKSAGNVPASVKQMIEGMRSPTIDWRAVLRRFVDESARRDYSWTRPNRRFVGSGIYLPGSVPDGMRKLGILIDTSGSLPDQVFSAFMSEVAGAVDDAQPDEVHIVQCDSRVHLDETFSAGDSLPMTIKGRGGTDMDPGLQRFEDCAAIICLTDLCFGRSPKDPGIPVLWAQWGKGGSVPAFGEVVHVRR